MKKIYALTLIAFFCLASFGAFAQLTPVISPIQGPSSVCSNPASPKTYSVSATNSPTGYSWIYSGPSGVVFSNPSGSVTTISFPYPSLNVTYTLYCTALNNAGASGTSSLVVTVFETPSVTFSGAQSFCQGSSTNISASPTILSASSSLSYNWSPPTGLNTTTGHSVTASPASTTNYTVLLTLGNCTNTAQVTLVVYPQPCVLGINDLAKNNSNLLSVYPNPNNGTFIMKSTKDDLVTILNEIGQTVRSIKVIAGEETKVTDLPAGIYFIMTPETRKKIIVTR